MRTSIVVACFTSVCIAGTFVSAADDPESRNRILRKAEPRLRAIYAREEFRPKRFRADWLPDSSGYTVLEPVPGVNEPATVRYDVASGQRTVLETRRKEEPDPTNNVSPDGHHVLYTDRGNLHVRDLRSGRSIPLTTDGNDESVSNSQATWSPDGTRIA